MTATEGTFQNFIRERNKTMISKTWQGYEISKRRKGTEFKLYVKSIYKGKITWTTDYTHAKHYTEKTAKRLDAEIDEGIRNGEFDNDILADSEVQEVPEVVEEQKLEVKRYDLGNVRCTLEETSKRHGYYRVTVEWDDHTFVNRFHSRAEAIEEILSYAEVDEF